MHFILRFLCLFLVLINFPVSAAKSEKPSKIGFINGIFRGRLAAQGDAANFRQSLIGKLQPTDYFGLYYNLGSDPEKATGDNFGFAYTDVLQVILRKSIDRLSDILSPGEIAVLIVAYINGDISKFEALEQFKKDAFTTFLNDNKGFNQYLNDNGTITNDSLNSSTESIVSQVRSDLKLGYRVEIVGYSQGSLYGSDAYRIITTQTPSNKSCLSMTGIGVLSRSVGGNGKYVTYLSDIVVNAVRVIDPIILPPTYASQNPEELLTLLKADLRGHLIGPIYLNSEAPNMRNTIIENTILAISPQSLKNPAKPFRPGAELKCPAPTMSPLATSVQLSAQVGKTGKTAIEFTNASPAPPAGKTPDLDFSVEADQSDLSLDYAPAPLKPGATEKVTATFTCVSRGKFKRSVNIKSDDPDADDQKVAVEITCGDEKPDIQVSTVVAYEEHASDGPKDTSDCPKPPDRTISYTAKATMTILGIDPKNTGWAMKKIEGGLNGAYSKAQDGAGPLTVIESVETGNYLATGRLSIELDGQKSTVEGGKSFRVDVPPTKVISGGPAPKCDKPPPVPCVGCKGGGNRGDPHLRTFDRLAYSFQGVGEYVFARTPDRTYDVQIRFKQEGAAGSSNSAIAMNVGGDTVGFYALGATGSNGGVGLLTINDQELPFSLTSKLSRDLPKGGRINVSGNPSLVATATVTWPDGNAAVILLRPEVFSFVTLYVPPAIQGTLQGLLGNADGDVSNDFKGRDGTAYPTNPSFEQLYKGFGDSWRVQPTESLFRYGAGQSTSTFTRLDFPPPPQPIALPVAAQAEATCRAAGVTDAEAVKDCTFDVAVSQKPELAQSALQYDPNHPSLAVSPANTAVGAGQQVQLRASVQGQANLADVQWTTTGGTLSANLDGVVTLSAPSTVGPLTVTATVAGATSTAVVAVRSSAISATSSASAFVGQGIPLEANLIGDLAGKPLVWSAARGSVTPSGNTVTYTAPSTPGDDTVTVQMQGDPAVSATIPVQVLGAQISLSPAVIEARVGEVIGFNVTYGGLGQAAPSIDWASSGGTLAPGLGAARYTAPSQPGTYTVTASVSGQPNLNATARITVIDQKITLSPAAVNVDPGETQRLQAELSSFTFPPSLTWATSGGTLVPDGNAATFTAPRQPGVYTVTASGANLQGTAQVTVPEFKPSIDTTWSGSEAIAFPGMTVSLIGSGLRPERAVWTATAGTLSAASGTNGVTFTTPAQPGDVTLSYSHSLFPDVQVSTKLSVRAPNLVLVTPKDQYDVGERIEVQVQGVPKYLCSQLKTTLGSVGNCYVSFTPTTEGPQTFTVNLDGVPNTTVTKTVQVSGLRLVADTTRVHGGLNMAVHALSSNGQPYAGSLNWSATGGNVAVQGSDAIFTAAATPGTYAVMASPQSNPSLQASLPVEVYLDPITLRTTYRNEVRERESLTVFANRPDGSRYPVPLTWQSTGGSISSVNNDNIGVYTFTAGSSAGAFIQTAQVTAAPQVSASLTLNVVDLAPFLKLADGREVNGKQVITGQKIATPFEARTIDGQAYAGGVDWRVYGTPGYQAEFTPINANQAQLSAIPYKLGSLILTACEQQFQEFCSFAQLNVNPLTVTKVNIPPAGDLPGILIGETASYQVTGTTDFPARVTWDWQEESLRVAFPTQVNVRLPTTFEPQFYDCATDPNFVAIGLDGSNAYSDYPFAFPVLQASVNGVIGASGPSLVRTNNGLIHAQFSCFPQPHNPPVIVLHASDLIKVTALLPAHTTDPQFGWVFNGTAINTSSKTVEFSAPAAPGDYILSNHMVTYPKVASSIVFRVIP